MLTDVTKLHGFFARIPAFIPACCLRDTVRTHDADFSDYSGSVEFNC